MPTCLFDRAGVLARPEFPLENVPDYAGVIFQTLSVLYSRGDFDAYLLNAISILVRYFIHRLLFLHSIIL